MAKLELPRRMLKTWTLCEKTGEVVVDADASKPSRSLRSDMRMIESSLEGGGGVDGIPPATCFVGDEDAALRWRRRQRGDSNLGQERRREDFAQERTMQMVSHLAIARQTRRRGLSNDVCRIAYNERQFYCNKILAL